MVAVSGRLSKAPLVYALCQIRFSSVLKMKELIPDIQEKLRERYEGFEEEQVAGIQVPAKGQPIVQAETRWRFESADQRSGYILQNAALVFHTTNYSDFDDFVPEIVRGFDVVATIARIQHIQRVGLRYVDLIESDSNNPAESFLHEHLRGFGSELGEIAEMFSQYLYRGNTDIGQLILKVTRGRHEIPLPPDLLPMALKSARKPLKDGISIFLDTDHFAEKADSPIPVANLEKMIRDLKAPIRTTFKKAISELAVKSWA